MKQARVSSTVRKGEYIPPCVDSSDFLVHIAHVDFRVGIKNVSVSLYKNNGTYILNHMVTSDTIRDHFCLSGDLQELSSKVEQFLTQIEKSIIWEIIYRELFEHTDEDVPEISVTHTYSPEYFVRLFKMFDKDIYSKNFTTIYKNTPLITLFPDFNFDLHNKQNLFIGSRDIHKVLSQTLALRKLRGNTVETVFWFGKVLSDNSVEIMSDTSEIQTVLNDKIEAQVKRNQASEYKTGNIDRFINKVLDITENVCFVFNRSSMSDSISKQTAESIQDSTAHAIISDTNTLLNRFTDEWVLSLPQMYNQSIKNTKFVLQTSDSMNDINTFKITHNNNKFTTDKMQFNNFELVPLEMVEESEKNIIPDFYSTQL